MSHDKGKDDADPQHCLAVPTQYRYCYSFHIKYCVNLKKSRPFFIDLLGLKS